MVNHPNLEQNKSRFMMSCVIALYHFGDTIKSVIFVQYEPNLMEVVFLSI